MNLAEFIKTHVDEINNNEFTEVYEDLLKQLASNYEGIQYVGKFTDILIDAGITPLIYMNTVPRGYMTDSSQTHVEIPDNITKIDAFAFVYAKNLTEIEIPDNVTDIGQSAFRSCANLSRVTIPDSIEMIKPHTFAYCENLTDIVIPDSLKDIDVYAFDSCTKIQNIYITDMATWFNLGGSYEIMRFESSNKNLYLNNKLVTSITIPNSVSLLPTNAFCNCASLTSATIPDSMTSIGMHIFYGCSGLTSVTIPDSVTKIDRGAFYGCSKLKSITFNGTKAQWTAISKEYRWNTKTGNYTIYCTDGKLKKGEK